MVHPTKYAHCFCILLCCLVNSRDSFIHIFQRFIIYTSAVACEETRNYMGKISWLQTTTDHIKVGRLHTWFLMVLVITEDRLNAHFDDSVQGCSTSSSLAMEILQSCTKPWAWKYHLISFCGTNLFIVTITVACVRYEKQYEMAPSGSLCCRLVCPADTYGADQHSKTDCIIHMGIRSTLLILFCQKIAWRPSTSIHKGRECILSPPNLDKSRNQEIFL